MSRGKLTIYPLGSGGWIPSNNLETLSICFFHDDEIFILDAGTGISRLLQLKDTLFKDRWSGLKGARICLSHYHFDHIAGLFWLRAILKGIPVTIYAPGKGIYGMPAERMLTEFFRKPFSPYPFNVLIPDVRVHDLDPPGIEIDTSPNPMSVRVKENPRHSDPSVSMRFGDSFAFVTDTPPEEETIEFARGVGLLMHECYYDSSDQFVNEEDDLESHRSGPHTGSFGAGLIAKRAGVERLVLIHHNPEIPIREVFEYSKRVSDVLKIDCIPAMDLEEIVIEE